MRSALRDYAPVLGVAAFTLLLKAYGPVSSPVIGALDPWGWVAFVREFLRTGETSPFFFLTGYPPTYSYVVAAISSTGIDAYDVIRYMPIVSFLEVIPIYLLSIYAFNSRAISVLSAVLAVTARYHFMRTSLGIPEAAAQALLAMTLLFVAWSLDTGRWKHRTCAALLMAATLLYYHFTFVILIPFLAILPTLMVKQRRATFSIVMSILVPATLLAGGVWYFRVADNIIRTYLLERHYDYPVPVGGSPLFMLGFSVGKFGVLAASNLGYLLLVSGAIGFVYSLLGKDKTVPRAGRNFLATYLLVLGFSAIVLVALSVFTGARGASSVYMFSWLAMPLSVFASYAFVKGTIGVHNILAHASFIPPARTVRRVLVVILILFVCVVNLSAANYYKAWSGNGLGFMAAHYSYKCLTDNEYYGLQYIRDNSPTNSIVLTVGVEDPILAYHVMVSRRTTVSIKQLRTEAGHIVADVEAAYDGMTPRNFTMRIDFDSSSGQQVYLMLGIKTVSLDVATNIREPPPENALMEGLLKNDLIRNAQCEYVYENHQITLLRISSVTIEFQTP